jgi:hypothetical protein
MDCRTKECGRKAEFRGYCRNCYSRLMRSGKLEKLPVKTKDKCKVEECQRLVGSDGVKGFCSMHYQRYKKHGDPRISHNNTLKGDTLAQKLRLNYKEDEYGCWIWQGYKQKQGYGVIGTGAGKKTALVHRLAYEFWNCPIPEGMLVCHHCDIPSCINPDHLFLGTNQDNIDDKMSKGRAYTGVHTGEKNSMAKLTDKQVAEIKRLLIHKRKSQVDIARQFGVSPTTILHIKQDKRWKHISWPKK